MKEWLANKKIEEKALERWRLIRQVDYQRYVEHQNWVKYIQSIQAESITSHISKNNKNILEGWSNASPVEPQYLAHKRIMDIPLVMEDC